MIGESLKINTTLTTLNLSCDVIKRMKYNYDNNTKKIIVIINMNR